MHSIDASCLTRRGILGAAASLPFARIARAAPGEGGWTHDAYLRAMHQSGRPVDQTEAQFAAIQARKPAMLARIEAYLKQRLGNADPALLRAFAEVPRDYYHYNYADHRAFPGEAYEDTPKPWAIGYGSALSDYLGQAYMTQICRPGPDDAVLEIGTGSGCQSSILSRIVRSVHSIEIIEPIGHAVGRIFAPIGYANIESRVGDGYYGWPEVAGGFDIIIVTCAAQYPPPDLFRQLKPGGRMIIPIGQPFKRGQVLYVYTRDAEGKVHSRRDMGVFFIPMTGAMMKDPPPAPVATVSDSRPAAQPPAPQPLPFKVPMPPAPNGGAPSP